VSDHLKGLTLFSAVGRAIEVGLSTWGSCYWDELDQCLAMTWNELKVTMQKYMCMIPDAKRWEMCFFTVFIMYFSYGELGIHEEGEAHWIFPELSKDGGKYASITLSRLLESVEDQVPAVRGMPSKGFRYSAANILWLHKDGGQRVTAARG
jgi:hypothetical protein